MSPLINCFTFQSASALEFVKKDLQEFTQVMHDDTTKVATDVKNKLTVSGYNYCRTKLIILI